MSQDSQTGGIPRYPLNNSKPLTVCYFGTYRADYARNKMMIEGLRRAGVTVLECHEKLWDGIEDRVQAASGGWLRPAFLLRLVKAYWRLILRHARIKDYDLLIVGYPGQFDVYLARLFAWIRHRLLVWDVLESIYLIARERNLDQASRWTVNLIGWVEKNALNIPDLLTIDTPEHLEWLQETYHSPIKPCAIIPIGADDRYYQPAVDLENANSIVKIVYFGTFIPNHGVHVIIEAARLLVERAEIRFILIGDGPDQASAVNLVEQYQLENVEFIRWLEIDQLVAYLHGTDIVLGTFGCRPQSLITVHNKVFEGMAIRKPVITGDSPAVRRLFTHREHLFLCERENPTSLADAILKLTADHQLRDRIAQQGAQLYYQQFDLQHNGQRFADQLHNLIGQQVNR